MLFNKHSETKQRFGIRKLTIGATSVLLSTLFLTVNNGQKVHAATNETVTSTDNKSGTEDNTATTEEKQTGDVATTADKSSDTSTPEDKVSSEGKTEDVTNTEEVTKPASGQKKFATTDKTMKIFTKMLVAAPAPSTTCLSDDGLVATDDQGVTLSMSKKTLGEGGQLGKSGITVKLSGTVSAGDVYNIQVPDFGWGYGPINDSTITTAGALGNFATAKKTNVVIDGQNYANYQITFKQGITIDSKGFQIVLNNGNNYYGFSKPTTTLKDGIYDQNIYWSRSSQADPTKVTENSSLSFTRKVETGFNKPTFNLTAPDGNKVSALVPDTDYQFTLKLNQGTGLNGLTDFTAAQINSARNYGSVITIPVPEGFVLNQDISVKNSQIGDKTTIEQVGGAGGDIIITVPKGSGRQGFESAPGYVIVGRFINHPETTSTFTAAGNITVTEQVLTKDGTKEIKAVLPPWQITLKGAKDKPSEGQFGVQAWGNNNGNIFTQTVPTKIANYFNFTNNSALAYENNLHLTFDFDDGLAINALSTPKINDIDRYGTRSYTYTLTLTDGTKVTGTIDAGGKIDVPTKTMTVTVKENDEGKEVYKDVVVPVTIKSADLVPDFWAAGAHGDGILNQRTGGNFGTNQLISDETFMAYGYISDVLNNDLHLPKDTKVKSTLTVSSPAYRPDTKFYATDTQTVMSKDSIKSALWASGKQDANNRYYSPEIDYTKEKYGSISINVSNDSKKASNRIVEPTFYYVLPAYTNFTGDLTNLLNLNPGITDGDKSKENIKPKLTSYMVGNQQVIKLDYSGTGFVYDANKDGNTLPIAIDADAEPGVYKWNVYLFTQTGIVNHDAITNTSDVANKYTQNVVQEAEKAGKSGSLYMIGQGDWEIKTPPVAYAPNTVQGNLDVKSVANGKSDDKGSEEMNYATEIANYSSGSIKDPYMLINFPQADPKNSFTFELTGPEEFIALNNNLGKDDFTTYYSTKTQDLPTVKDRGKVPDMTGYVTAGQVTDWSKIKSAVIKFNTTLPGGTVLGQIVFKGKDSTLKTDAGKTSYFRAAVMGETINPFLTENTSIKVVGKSTVNTRLHYQDTDRQDHYINVPTMTKEYNDNVDTMKSSDFALNSIPKELIPDHYELVANQVPSIINNEDGNSKDATAEFNKTVTYAFDGDIVQFELEPKNDKATQTINRTVHFRTDGDNSKEVAEDVSTPVTVTELTNEVTGEKQYSAKITVNGQTQDLLVHVGQNGQISLTLPKVDIPDVSDYYVVDSTKTQADAISKTFAFTKDGTLTFENTVKYAPVKQELQIKVYDDESNTPGQALDTTDSGATTDFTGNSKSDFPADVATNLQALKDYYERKNYEVVTLPAASGKFDSTNNGSGADTQVQFLEVHLKHVKDVKTESIKVVREVTYSVDSTSPDAPKAPDAKVDTFDGVFSRTVTTDKVNNNVTKSDWSGTYTSNGVTSPKLADGYHPDKEIAAKATISADFLKNTGEDEIAKLISDGLKVSDEVVYSADKQTVKIRVYDDTTNSELSPVTAKSELEGQGKNVEISLDGLTNSDIPAKFSSNIDLLKSYYKSKGYKFVSNTAIPAKFDATSNGTGQTDSTPQYVDIHLEHKKITVTNDDPKDPDGKITTDKGYDHNYPTGVSETDLNNTVRRNISFIYTDKPEGRNQAFPTETQEVAYKRQATIDLVKLANGDSDAVSYSNWEPKEAGKESFDRCQVKPIKGYVANYELVPSADVHKDQDGKAENGQDVVVKYSPVGKIIPIDKDGNEIPNAPTPKYNNDPTDPTKTTTTNVPEIPGYHAEVPNVTPDNPLEDTKVVYVKNTQAIDLVYVDTKTNTTLTTQNDVAHGDSGSTIPTSVTDTLNSTIQSYLDKGYVIDPYKVSGTVPDTFDFSDQTADGADKEHQVVTIYLTHGTVTVTGNDPKTPGEPINPKDPNGSKYPPEAGKDNLVISSQNIIHYYDEAGNKLRDDKVTTDDSTLTREVTIDKVTSDVISTGKWTGGKEYENVNTPVVNGYYTDRASAGASTVTPADADPNSGRVHNGVITNETTVIYHPMGHIIPIDKSGNKIPGAETPIFNNDPNDPTKGSTTKSPIIPGYHLETPSDSAITPDDPGKDRKVVYVADTQNLVVQVFDKDSKTPDQPLDTTKTGATVEFTGDSFTNFPTDVATNIDALIKYYEARGYKVKTKPSPDELSAKFDGDKDITQYLKLVLTHDTEIVTGENPKTPGTPINPDDPDSPTYGEETSREHLVIKSVDVIEYEGAGDKTPETNTRTNDATLIKNVTIDKVTGEVIATGEWTGKFIYEPIKTPKIDGYTVSLENAGGTAISSGDANEAVAGVITRKVKVVYTPEKQELQLKVYDQDLDKYLGKTDSFYGLTDQEVGEDPQTRLDELKKQFAERGFDIVEVPELAKNYDNTENGTSDQDNKPQVFVLVVKHHIETVTPDDPKTPDDKIPNTNQNYPGGLTETDLSKTITRTIIVHMPDGSTKEIKQEVVYTRTATVDSVTKEVTYTDWTSKNSNWSEYQSPDIPGYTVDIEKVELAKVPVDGHDVTVEINYTADPVPDEPVNPSNPGNPGTTTPDQPQQPGKPTDPTKPSEPNKPSNPGRPTNPNHPTKPTKPVTPAKPDQTHDQHSKVNGETDLNGFVDGISDEKAGAVAGASDNAQAGAKKLPQTSGESGWQASLLGMGLFFISLFGFKKKKEDE